jgi:hypothetical protein
MDEIGRLIGKDAVTALQSLAASANDTRAGAVASLFGISLAQPTAATKDGVDPVRVGLTSRRRSLQSLKR